MTTTRSTPETAQSADGVLQLDTHVSLRRVHNDRIHFLNLDRCLRQPCTTNAVSAPETIAGVSLAENYLLQMPTFVSDYTNLIELNAGHNEFNNAEFILHRALNDDELSESYRTERLNGITKESPTLLIDCRPNRGSTVRRSVQSSTKPIVRPLVHPFLQSIHLSFNRIKTLPTNIHYLRFLHTLDLSHNHLTNLPNNFGCLEQLHTLLLNNNYLTTLPGTFTRLMHLEFLDLSANHLQSIDTMKNLVNLKSFQISSNPLKTFPLLLYSCTNIEHLSFSNAGLSLTNEITFDYFARFSQLKKLDLSNNALTDHFMQAPERSLNSLEELYLQANRLTDISSLLSRMPSLSTVDLSSNSFSTIPRTQHSQLQILRLANNQIVISPDDCRNLKHIIELDLAHNQVSDLPHEFLHCSRLQTLNISSNPLEKVPAILFQLRSLNNLVISSANVRDLVPIEHFHKYFSRTINRLDLSNNHLHTSLTQLTALKALTYLDLSGNQLSELDREFRAMTCLTVLKLSRNRFRKLPSCLYEMAEGENTNFIGETLVELYMDDNHLEIIPDEIVHMTGLQTIDLSNNQLARFPEPLLYLDQLQCLIYSQRHGIPIENLPADFVHLYNLTKLDLSHNIFYEIPSCIYSLTKLAYLDMSSNLLTALENNRLKQLKNLKMIKLNDNRFPSFPSSLYQLESFRIDGNSSCSAPPNDFLDETCAPAVSNLFVRIHDQHENELFQIYRKILIDHLPNYDIERLLIRLKLPDKDVDDFRRNHPVQTKREEKVESLLNMWKQKRDSLANSETLYELVQLIADKPLSQNIRKASLLARKIRI